MLEPVMFTGGLYKHDLVVELVEDLGGYVLQKNVTQTEIILLILIPSEDMAALESPEQGAERRTGTSASGGNGGGGCDADAGHSPSAAYSLRHCRVPAPAWLQDEHAGTGQRSGPRDRSDQ